MSSFGSDLLPKDPGVMPSVYFHGPEGCGVWRTYDCQGYEVKVVRMDRGKYLDRTTSPTKPRLIKYFGPDGCFTVRTNDWKKDVVETRDSTPDYQIDEIFKNGVIESRIEIQKVDEEVIRTKYVSGKRVRRIYLTLSGEILAENKYNSSEEPLTNRVFRGGKTHTLTHHSGINSTSVHTDWNKRFTEIKRITIIKRKNNKIYQEVVTDRDKNIISTMRYDPERDYHWLTHLKLGSVVVRGKFASRIIINLWDQFMELHGCDGNFLHRIEVDGSVHKFISLNGTWTKDMRKRKKGFDRQDSQGEISV